MINTGRLSFIIGRWSKTDKQRKTNDQRPKSYREVAEWLTKIARSNFEHNRCSSGYVPQGEAHDVPNNAHVCMRLRLNKIPELYETTHKKIYREVAEWLKAHAWKVCKPKGFEGSNPFLSANL